jgi:hypothetical protein
MVDLENATDDELDLLEHQFQRLRARVTEKKE